MLSEHELKIDQYYDEFKDYIDPPKLKIRDKNLINEGQESTENEEDMSSCWADKCVFQCDVCVPNEVFDSLFNFEKHVHCDHQMTKDEYFNKHGRTVRVKKHTCQVCGAVILWEKGTIYNHLIDGHEMSL